MRRGKFLILLVGSVLLGMISVSGQTQPAAQDRAEPKITAIRFIAFGSPTADCKVSFGLAIEGENLPAAEAHATVHFDTKDPASSISDVPVTSSNSKEILVNATAKVGTEITRVAVIVESRIVTASEGFTLSIKANPPTPKLAQFEIKFDHQKNKEFPNLHSVVVTKVGGDGGFADSPHKMTVDLVPTGATDVNIVQTNSQQLDLHFVAAADYEPKTVVVTVYSGTDLDNRTPLAVSVDKKPAEDPEQPKVTEVETVFINRSHGVGRIRIHGKGFGDYPPPPYPVDDYLWNCLEEFHIRGTNADKDDNPRVHKIELEDLGARLDACAKLLGGTVKEGMQLEQIWNQLQYTKMNLASFVTKPDSRRDWEAWGQEIREKATVGLSSRNPDIAVEKVAILDINDKMIDVYFEFTRSRGFAWPFRLEDVTVTVKKTLPKITQTVKNDTVTGTATSAKEETYTVPYQAGPKRDANLTYKYTVLDKESANTLLGKGIADNFYVLQLSVVNNGEKKVNIPLASIQAEVEWIRGDNKGRTISYMPGPVTLAPIPLAAVSGYFDAYQKVKGFRAHFFNALEAATMMATSLVPYAGPSFKDAELFFSGAFLPGVRKALGDLSGQQLQHLTALSWESAETLPGKGGSKEKLIYIQRNEQFASKGVETDGKTHETRKQIANIMDLEIAGFEVVESEAKQATPTPTTPPSTGPASASETTPKPAPPATSTPPAPKGAGSEDKKKPE
jgi:hypothetical protein